MPRSDYVAPRFIPAVIFRILSTPSTVRCTPFFIINRTFLNLRKSIPFFVFNWCFSKKEKLQDKKPPAGSLPRGL